eukprot:GFKZ01013075.1.p1 GENE.GFKZ01013075.1~~GFKZ01013075.1.p1  ORF type:complete len:112 (-),score=1.10 GFKZ01013075.1:65-400(-)
MPPSKLFFSNTIPYLERRTSKAPSCPNGPTCAYVPAKRRPRSDCVDLVICTADLYQHGSDFHTKPLITLVRTIFERCTILFCRCITPPTVALLGPAAAPALLRLITHIFLL